jgi:hypothetical protein
MAWVSAKLKKKKPTLPEPLDTESDTSKGEAEEIDEEGL